MESRMVSELSTAAIAVGTATAATNPVEVVKVRLQLQQRSQLSMLSTGMSILRTEGLSGLASGMTPSVTRAVVYGGMRVGLYSPVKDMMVGEQPSGQVPFAVKMGAGSMAGALAAVCTNPIDLAKTRLQAQGPSNASAMQVVRAVVRQEGVLGLWRGSTPAAARAALLNASQCATYDEIKQHVLAVTGRDGFTTHLCASLLTGLITTTITNPVDVIKTRMFVEGGSSYSSPLHCGADIVRNEGVGALFKGWSANFARLGPMTVIMFVTVEQLRKLTGLRSI